MDVLLWGGTGQARVLRPIIEKEGHSVVAVFDRNVNLQPPFANVPLFHSDSDIEALCADYEERPLGRALDDGLWREYQEALQAARRHRSELREAMTSRIQAARAGHAERFKLRHHAIAAMPIATSIRVAMVIAPVRGGRARLPAGFFASDT